MDWIIVKCEVCKRYGRYGRARFFRITGTENAPDALVRFAAKIGCERAMRQEQASSKGYVLFDDRCKIHYQNQEGETPAQFYE